MDSSWSEDDKYNGTNCIFWNGAEQKWFGFDTTALDSVPYDATVTEVTFDVSKSIKRFMEDGIDNRGFFIKTYSPICEQIISENSGDQGGTWTSWWSHEYEDVTKRPKLEIEFDYATALVATPQKKNLECKISNNQILFSSAIRGRVGIYSIRGTELYRGDINGKYIAIPKSIGHGNYILKVRSADININKMISLIR
jgi:hypothetical protein